MAPTCNAYIHISPPVREALDLSPIDKFKAEVRDPFTMESFESLLEQHQKKGQQFLIAQVKTENKQGRTFTSYYAAHHLNKVIFRTEWDLLHRIRALNPLNNMVIIGDVNYYVVSPNKRKDFSGIRNFLLSPEPKEAETQSIGTFAFEKTPASHLNAAEQTERKKSAKDPVHASRGLKILKSVAPNDLLESKPKRAYSSGNLLSDCGQSDGAAEKRTLFGKGPTAIKTSALELRHRSSQSARGRQNDRGIPGH